MPAKKIVARAIQIHRFDQRFHSQPAQRCHHSPTGETEYAHAAGRFKNSNQSRQHVEDAVRGTDRGSQFADHDSMLGEPQTLLG